MPSAIRIDLVRPSPEAFRQHRTQAPLCLNIGPLHVAGTASFFVATFETGKGSGSKSMKRTGSEWLAQFISSIQAEEVRVNGRETKDRAELHRLIAEELSSEGR